ncbi:MAG TPA: M4 family metallopeptidase [Thermoanaerobaculia bacterium]
MHLCSFVPPHVLRRIAERGDEGDRVAALATLELSRRPRSERQASVLLAGVLTPAPRRKRRTVFDARGTHELPGLHMRGEGSSRVRDPQVNEAYESAGRAYDFFRRVYGRHSIDDRGIRLDSTVHFGEGFSNAHWDGRRVIYGDGDGRYFRGFTSSIDVVTHELTHGVSQYSAGLGFSGQTGAIAEHMSDVFAVLARQYWRGETTDQSDWLIGSGIFTDAVSGSAIRSMKAPGTAYDDPILGRDPQPSHMSDFVRTRANHGGVHINSGIPNHAFYRVAAMLGGHAWETAGRVWYDALTRRLTPRTTFQQCADATALSAAELSGTGGNLHQAVLAGWLAVGIEVREPAPRLRVRSVRETVALPEPGAELPYFA